MPAGRSCRSSIGSGELLRAVHVLVPSGRVSLSALAAPRSTPRGGTWPTRSPIAWANDGARVGGVGRRGREVLAASRARCPGSSGGRPTRMLYAWPPGRRRPESLADTLRQMIRAPGDPRPRPASVKTVLRLRLRNILRAVERAREQAARRPEARVPAMPVTPVVPVTPTGGRIARPGCRIARPGWPRARRVRVRRGGREHGGFGFRGAGRFAGWRPPGSAGLAAGSGSAGSPRRVAGLAAGGPQAWAVAANLAPPGCHKTLPALPRPRGPTDRRGRPDPASRRGQANRLGPSKRLAEQAGGAGPAEPTGGPGQPSRPAGPIGPSHGTGPGGAPRRLVRRPVARPRRDLRRAPARRTVRHSRPLDRHARPRGAERTVSLGERHRRADTGQSPGGTWHRSGAIPEPTAGQPRGPLRRRALRGHRQLGAVFHR